MWINIKTNVDKFKNKYKKTEQKREDNLGNIPKNNLPLNLAQLAFNN